MAVKSIFRRYVSNRQGNIAIFFAIASFVILMAIGVAIDGSRVLSMKSSAQDNADNAALAAAIYMTESATSGLSEAERKRKAEEIALTSLAVFFQSTHHLGVEPHIKINTEDVRVNLDIKAAPVLMNMFGHKSLDHKVASVVGIGKAVARDIDIALISDATGSMQTTLDAIQNNMKDFTVDLTYELTSRKIEMGNVRVKFIFYRDLIVDNHKDWTGPKMALQAGLEMYGPLYSSDFFTLPSEKNTMDNYVDFFLAQGGGSARESGLEAIWHVLGESDWGNGADTVRSIVLWTDAPTRPIEDIEEWGLQPEPDPTLAYWNDEYWREKMGDFFVPWSKETREQYMYDTYAQAYTPPSIAALKSRYDTFHSENSGGMDDVQTMTINVIGNCLDVLPCGDWPQIAAWEGVDYYYESNVFSESETYANIVQQVADTVEKQLMAKELAIRY